MKDLFGLGDAPIAKVLATVDSIAKVQGVIPASIASAFELQFPDRLDFWLFRRLVFNGVTFCREELGEHAASYVEGAICGLKDEAISHDLLRVLSRVSHKQLKEIGEVVGEGVLGQLAEAFVSARESFTPSDMEERLISNVLFRSFLEMIGETRRTLNKQADQESTGTATKKRIHTYVPFDHVVALFDDLTQGLSSAYENSQFPRWVICNPLPESLRPRLHPFIPWREADTLIATATALLNCASYIEHVDVSTIKESENHKHLLERFGQARDLVQTAWLTLTAVQKSLKTTPAQMVAIRQREVKALAQLARYERFCRNFSRSGIYAVFALQRDRTLRTPGLSDAETTSLLRLAGGLGLDMPGRGEVQAHEQINANTPNIVAVSLLRDPKCVDHINKIESQTGLYWFGLGEGVLAKIAGDMTVYPEVLASAFIMAVRTGALTYARHISAKLVKQYEAAKFDQESVVFQIDSAAMMEFANALSALSQKTIAVTHHESQKRFRVALRRLWKHVNCEKLSHGDWLFLHHATVGWTHYACANFADVPLATWAAYSSIPDQGLVVLYEKFMTKVRYGTVPALTRQDFKNCCLEIEPDAAFVSLVMRDGREMRDGYEVSVITYGPNGSTPRHQLVLADKVEGMNGGFRRQDWYKVVYEFFQGACLAVRSGAALPLDVPALVRLAEIIVSDAVAVNPNVKCICLHTDSMFRTIPWQFVLQTKLRQYVRDTFEQEEKAKRRNVPDPWRDLFVCHVPSVLPPPAREVNATELSFPRMLGEVRFDQNDAFCRTMGTRIGEIRKAGGMSSNHLSLVSHGRINGYVGKIELAGEALSETEVREQLSGFPIVIVHACYGGYAFANATGDMGGLSGFLLSHGSHTVLASPTPVIERQALDLEQYLGALRASDPTSIETAYMNAVRENPSIGLYSLFSKGRAPILLPND